MKRKLKKIVAFLLTLVTVALLVPVSTVTAVAESPYAEMMNLVGATIRYTDKMGNTTGENASGLRFAAVIDNVVFGAWIIPTDLLTANANVMASTEGVVDVELKRIYAQDENELHFTVSLLGIPEEDYNRDFTIRLYMKTQKNGKWQYTYSMQSIARNLVDVANDFYFDNRENEALCRNNATMFAQDGLTLFWDLENHQIKAKSNTMRLITDIDSPEIYGANALDFASFFTTGEVYLNIEVYSNNNNE